MFTGLIETIGTFTGRAARGGGEALWLAAPAFGAELVRGESIAVDGACLTVEEFDGAGNFAVFTSPETLRRTSLGALQTGSRVNLERALTLGTRLGGHLVQGHIDTTGTLAAVRDLGETWEVDVAAPPAFLRQCITKGSVAIAGISLTIATLHDDRLTTAIIPETWTATTLADRAVGDVVNLEADMIGKYVFRFLESQGAEAQGHGNEARLAEVWAAFRG